MEPCASPTVLAIYTARAAGEPMQCHTTAELVAGCGIAGDRYSTRLGRWSDPQWRDQQLTLVNAELIDELGLTPEALRRNIVVRGIDLHDLIGLEFAIGETRIQGRRICSPCGYIGRLNNRKGLAAELGERGGIRAAVIAGGSIRVGDELRILGLGDPIADD